MLLLGAPPSPRLPRLAAVSQSSSPPGSEATATQGTLGIRDTDPRAGRRLLPGSPEAVRGGASGSHRPGMPAARPRVLCTCSPEPARSSLRCHGDRQRHHVRCCTWIHAQGPLPGGGALRGRPGGQGPLLPRSLPRGPSGWNLSARSFLSLFRPICRCRWETRGRF